LHAISIDLLHRGCTAFKKLWIFPVTMRFHPVGFDDWPDDELEQVASRAFPCGSEQVMGVFDQAARFGTRAAPEHILHRLLAGSGLSLTLRDWLDTRALPLPGGPDRTADLVAALNDATTPDSPWLMVLEFQAQLDADKLETTLEEVAILRARVRHEEDRKGKYKVMVGLVYPKDRCPENVLDMTLPNEAGTRHAGLVWNVAEDQAAQTLEAVAAEQTSWGMLFWVPLMAGGGADAVVDRWKEVVEFTVSDRGMRGNLVGIALVFAELAGCLPAWKRGLEGFEMTESQVVNEWIREAEVKVELKTQRRYLLALLDGRFPGMVPEEVRQLIQQQESLELLEDWFKEAVHASTFENFMAVLKR
jgi:hypothetical protein